MKLKIACTWLAISILSAIGCCPQPEKAALPPADFHRPAGLNLPLELTPSAGSAWQRERQTWYLPVSTAGELETAAWWKDDRPPQGEMVVLEVEYLDSLSLPVRAEVYSGLARNGNFSELHRFGGAGDGRWNTARIPCPWDMIMKYLPGGTLRFRLISDASPLRVRSFTLTAARPGDEEDYNRQSREWVARVQRAKAEVPDSYWELAQQATVENSTGELVVYSRNWMEPVLPVSAPQAGETDFPLKVRMTINEYQPLQLGVYANGTDLQNVVVSVSPFTDSSGRVVARVTARVAEYSLVKSRIEQDGVEPFPQRLWPAYPFGVPAGRSHMVWLTVHTEEATAVPGTYSTEVLVTAAGGHSVTVPLEVEILPVRLLEMGEAGLKLGGHTIGLLSEHDLAFQREYNHNMIDLWYGAARPELSVRGDSMLIDYRMMDDFMLRAARQGFSDVYYFLGGNPYGFPLTMDQQTHLAKSVLGLDDRTFRREAMQRPEEVHPRVAPLISEWTRRFNRHAFNHGWPRITYTPFDEPAKWVQTRDPLGSLAFIRPHFNHWAKLLREGDPHVMVAADIHHYQGGMTFLPVLDVFCTNATHENPQMPDMVREAGKVFWEFGGCNDRGLPGQARYVLGFYFASHDSRAAQLWAYNWGNRFDTLEGENWLYAWYTPFDVIPHPFMEGVREGMDERRLLETIKHTAELRGVDISAFISRLYEQWHDSDGDIRRLKLTRDNFWQALQANHVMDRWHDTLMDKLLELNAN